MRKWTLRKLVKKMRQLARERNMWRENYFAAQQANMRQYELLKSVLKKYCNDCESAEDCKQAPFTGYPARRDCAIWEEGGAERESRTADPGHGAAI